MKNLTEKNYNNEVSKEGITMVYFWVKSNFGCEVIDRFLPALESNKVSIAKVNVDDEKKLASKRSILSVPTILIYVDGEIVYKIIGSRTSTELLQIIDKVSTMNHKEYAIQG